MSSATKHNARLIKDEALRLGFSHCGISKAAFLEDEAPRLESWLTHRRHGEMSYMERNFDKRLDPRLLQEGTRSVVSLLLNYFPPESQSGEAVYKVSRYAFGEDYHLVIRRKLQKLMEFIRETIGEIQGRAFVDSAPVLDKVWAKKAGLGWIGKNTNLINPRAGSYFFIAELLLDIELEYDYIPVPDYCGTCTKCIDACPTQAIVQPYVVDGSRCISYHTIELKGDIPEAFKGTFQDWIFGCDVCQEVCPWNRFSLPHHDPDLKPNPELINMTKKDWQELTEEVFNKNFRASPLKRAAYAGIKRNIAFNE